MLLDETYHLGTRVPPWSAELERIRQFDTPKLVLQLLLRDTLPSLIEELGSNLRPLEFLIELV